MRGAVVITLTIATYALFLVMLQGEGVDAETEVNGTSTKLGDILVDKPTNLRDCIKKCQTIACQYKSLTKEEVLECICKCLELFWMWVNIQDAELCNQTIIIKYLVIIFDLGDSLFL